MTISLKYCIQVGVMRYVSYYNLNLHVSYSVESDGFGFGLCNARCSFGTVVLGSFGPQCHNTLYSGLRWFEPLSVLKIQRIALVVLSRCHQVSLFQVGRPLPVVQSN